LTYSNFHNSSESYILRDLLSALSQIYEDVVLNPQLPVGDKPYDVWPLFASLADDGIRHSHLTSQAKELIENSHACFCFEWSVSRALPEADVIIKTIHRGVNNGGGRAPSWIGDGMWLPKGELSELPLAFDYHPVVKTLPAERILGMDRKYAIWNCNYHGEVEAGLKHGIPQAKSGQRPIYELAFFKQCVEVLVDLDIKTLYLLRCNPTSENVTGVPAMLDEFECDVVPLSSDNLGDTEYEQLVTHSFCLLYSDYGRRAGMSIPIALANGVPVLSPNEEVSDPPQETYDNVGMPQWRSVKAFLNNKVEHNWREYTEVFFERAGPSAMNYYQHITGNPMHLVMYAGMPHNRLELSGMVAPLFTIDAAVARYRKAIDALAWWRAHKKSL
jgi:hypothetical protein